MDPRQVLSLRSLCALGAALLVVGVAACAGTEAQPATPKPVATADDGPEEKALDDSATIDADCYPPGQILIDGKPAGMSPLKGFKVKPGRHDVTFVDEQTGNRTMSVDIAPGDAKVVTSDRPPSATQKQPAHGDKNK